jgi:adenylosuccinate synthase
MVIDLEQLCKEVDELADRNVDVGGDLLVSQDAHVVMPYHKALDVARNKSAQSIGTTARGIGPVYSDKHAYMGIRVGDLFDRQKLRDKIEASLREKNVVFQQIYDTPPFEPDQIISELEPFIERVLPFVTDTSLLINRMLDDEKTVLFEGAQGTMLDIDHGTYPYVSSSHPIGGGVCIGAGVGPQRMDRIIGVVKAYITRVGNGPMPTELKNETGEHLRTKGAEFGATTGRPRRCGWFDCLIAKHARRVNGLTDIAITKLDVLDELESIKICEAYSYRGERITELPYRGITLEECEPILTELPGWQEDTSATTSYADLPEKAKNYVSSLSEIIGCPVTLIGVGPKRTQTLQAP